MPSPKSQDYSVAPSAEAAKATVRSGLGASSGIGGGMGPARRATSKIEARETGSGMRRDRRVRRSSAGSGGGGRGGRQERQDGLSGCACGGVARRDGSNERYGCGRQDLRG